MTKISHAFSLKSVCVPTKQKIGIPSNLPIRKNDHKYVASLSSSNPDELTKVLSFLFQYSTLTKSDKKTLKSFAKSSLMNSLIIDVFLTNFIQKSTIPFLLTNPNTVFAVKSAPKKVEKELLAVIVSLINMNDNDAYKLGLNLVSGDVYDIDLLNALFAHTHEEQASFVLLQKKYDKLLEKQVSRSLKRT